MNESVTICRLFDLLTDDGNGESLVYGASAAAADGHFIKSRVCGSGVCDGQRSSLMIQLQSVSEDDCVTVLLISATQVSPLYHIIFMYFSKISV